VREIDVNVKSAHPVPTRDENAGKAVEAAPTYFEEHGHRCGQPRDDRCPSPPGLTRGAPFYFQPFDGRRTLIIASLGGPRRTVAGAIIATASRGPQSSLSGLIFVGGAGAHRRAQAATIRWPRAPAPLLARS